MRLRSYIAMDEGLRRVPMNVIEGRVAVPRLADTRQNAIQALYEWRAGRLFLAARGNYLNFDERGIAHVTPEELVNAAELVAVTGAIEGERLSGSNITNVDLHRRVRQLKNEGQWKLSDAEREAVTVDLLGAARPSGTLPIPLLTATPHRGIPARSALRQGSE
jgi:hypothetical protein